MRSAARRIATFAFIVTCLAFDLATGLLLLALAYTS